MSTPSLIKLSARIAFLKSRLADPALPDRYRAVMQADLRTVTHQWVGRKISVNGITKGRYDGT